MDRNDAINSLTITNTSVFTKGTQYISSFTCTAVKTSVYIIITALSVSIGAASAGSYITDVILTSVNLCPNLGNSSGPGACVYKIFDTSGNATSSSDPLNHYKTMASNNKFAILIGHWRSSSTINTTFNVSSSPIWFAI